MGQNKPTAGSRHADVKEPFFFLVVTISKERARQQPILTTRNKNERPFKSFCRMKGHEGHTISEEVLKVDAPVKGKGVKKGVQIFEPPGKFRETA